MRLPFLPRIDFQTYRTASDGLEADIVDRLGQVYITVRPDSCQAACEYIRQNSPEIAVYADVSALSEDGDVVAVQEAGAAYIFLTFHQVCSLTLRRILHFDGRVAVIVDKEMWDLGGDDGHFYKEEVHRACNTGDGKEVGCLYTEVDEDHMGVNYLGSWVFDFNLTPEWIDTSEDWSLSRLYKAYVRADPVVDVSRLCVGVDENPDNMSIVHCTLLYITADQVDGGPPTPVKEGRYETIEFDEQGQERGQYISTAETLTQTLRTGRVVYLSQGEGSDEKYVDAALDLIKVQCDQDTCQLHFVVRAQQT